MTPSDVKATLSFSDGSPSVELPIYKGTMGPDVIDIRKLYGQTGKFTYDPGFMSTASCNSAITYIDGDKGELLYRGYPIDSWRRTRLPRILLPAAERRTAERSAEEGIRRHRDQAHDGARADAVLLPRLPPRRAPDGRPGRGSRRAVGVLPRLARHQRPAHREVSAIRLIAKMPTLVAMAYKYSIGQPFVYPKNDLSYSANFMRMMFATRAKSTRSTTCSCARWTAS
jgi:citrate synthase